MGAGEGGSNKPPLEPPLYEGIFRRYSIFLMNMTFISLNEVKIEYFIIPWQSEMQAMQSATKLNKIKYKIGKL